MTSRVRVAAYSEVSMRLFTYLLLPLLAALAGCSLSEEAFVQDFVEADCAYILECTSEPILAFQGWETEEDCRTDRGPEVAADAAACVYDKKAAKACLDALELEPCAAEGEDRVFPAICQDVFTLCDGADSDTGADTDTEASAQ